MVSDIGKALSTVKLQEGLCSFYNAAVEEESGVRWLDAQGNARYVLAADGAKASAWRALSYVRSYAAAKTAHVKLALYVPNYSQATAYGLTAMPLYETIAPSVMRDSSGVCQVTWWTNVDSFTGSAEHLDYYANYQSVHRFSNLDLESVEDSATSSKLLCTAPITWEMLRQEGGPGADGSLHEVPVIRHVGVLSVITGEGWVTDFSTGGGGGAMRMHAHTSNEDCGFAVATYAPSAMLRPISWS